MLSEQKMSMKLMIIGAVLLIAAVKGESTGFKLCNHWGNFSFSTCQQLPTRIMLIGLLQSHKLETLDDSPLRNGGEAFEQRIPITLNLFSAFPFSFFTKTRKAAPLKVKSSSISFYFPTESVYWTFYVAFTTPDVGFSSIRINLRAPGIQF